MRDDLLDAKAGVVWAKSHMRHLKKRIESWQLKRPYTVEIDTDSSPSERRYCLVGIDPVDPLISAEIGVIVHSIRSSLDILACALESRGGHPGSTKTQFPIWNSEEEFLSPRSRPWKYIERLSLPYQAVVRELKPYPGGNPYLFALHHLDVTRKHRRLLRTYVAPAVVQFDGGPHVAESIGGAVIWGADLFGKKPAVVVTAISEPQRSLYIPIGITFDEPALPGHSDIMATLCEFVRLANSIIDSFDV